MSQKHHVQILSKSIDARTEEAKGGRWAEARIGDLKVSEFIDLFNPVIEHPAGALADRLMKDPDWANTWHDNIAVALQDSGVGYKKSQRAAFAVMQALFGVDTSKHATNLVKNREKREAGER